MPVPQEVVDDELCRSGSEGSIFQLKFRIYKQFSESLSDDDNAKFLKKEFGTGGHSPLNDSGFWVDCGGKGITFRKGDFEQPEIKYTLTWAKAVTRVKELIAADSYLTTKDKEDLYPRYLEYLENQEIIRNKNAFLDSVSALPPAEKRDTLSLRLAHYLNQLEGYEKKYLDKFGLAELATTNADQVDAVFQNPQKTDQLLSALIAIKGATCDCSH